MPHQRTKLAQVQPETLEDLLHRIEDRAAMLRWAADSAVQNPQPPDTRALSGLADICADIERLAQQARELAAEPRTQGYEHRERS